MVEYEGPIVCTAYKEQELISVSGILLMKLRCKKRKLQIIASWERGVQRAMMRNACMHLQTRMCFLYRASSTVNPEQEADLQGSPGVLLHPKMKIRVQYMERSKGQETQLCLHLLCSYHRKFMV